MVIFHSCVKLPEGIWDNPSHWLSYFSRWLKPPTRKWTVRITCSGYCMWCVFLACAEKNLPAFPTCLAQGPNFPPLLTHIRSGSPKQRKGPFSLPGCHNSASYVWACLGMFGSARRSSSTTGKISCSTNTWSRRCAFGILMSPSALDNDGTVLIAAAFKYLQFLFHTGVLWTSNKLKDTKVFWWIFRW